MVPFHFEPIHVESYCERAEVSDIFVFWMYLGVLLNFDTLNQVIAEFFPE